MGFWEALNKKMGRHETPISVECSGCGALWEQERVGGDFVVISAMERQDLSPLTADDLRRMRDDALEEAATLAEIPRAAGGGRHGVAIEIARAIRFLKSSL